MGDTNTFARESHIDIVANQVGVDPLEFRLSHLSDKCIGRGVGVACAIYLGTYMATMAQVTVNKSTGRV